MSSTAKAQEPTMEEILASIRRIIADDEPGTEAKAPEKPAAKPEAAEKPAAKPAPAPVAAADDSAESELNQDDIDAMLAGFDAPPLPGKEPEAKDEDVLELKKPVAKSAEATRTDVEFRDASENAPAEAEAEEDLSGWGVEVEEEAPPQPAAPAMAPTASTAGALRDDGLMAPESSAVVASAFSSLATTILSQNARTLDDLVQEMLRPMLKSWLDENLPAVVERLVRAEIERVSRGPRR